MFHPLWISECKNRYNSIVKVSPIGKINPVFSLNSILVAKGSCKQGKRKEINNDTGSEIPYNFLPKVYDLKHLDSMNKVVKYLDTLRIFIDLLALFTNILNNLAIQQQVNWILFNMTRIYHPNSLTYFPLFMHFMYLSDVEFFVLFSLNYHTRKINWKNTVFILSVGSITFITYTRAAIIY